MRTLFLTTVISVAFAQAPSEPTDVQGWIRHGLEAVKAGRHDDALKAMDRALQIDPNNLHALHTLAFLQFNRDMLTEARATYERILGITPDGKEAHYGLAAVLSKNIESKRKEAARNRISRRTRPVRFRCHPHEGNIRPKQRP